jgi:hypothetical protein
MFLIIMATVEIQTEAGAVVVPVDALYEAVERRKDERHKEIRKAQNRVYYLQTREARLAADRARRLAAKAARLAAKADLKDDGGDSG